MTELPLVKTLAEKVGALPSVKDFFDGVRVATVLTPDNILCFCVKNGTHLSGKKKQPDHHGRFVLIVSLEGEGGIGIDGDTFWLKAEEAVLIFPFQFHYYFRAEQKLRWLFITFESPVTELASESLRQKKMRLGQEQLQCVNGFLDVWSDAFSKGRVGAWLTLLLEGFAAQKRSRAARVRLNSRSNEEILTRLNRWALSHMDQDLSLSQAARALGMSVSLLRSRFADITGRSLGAYLRSLRLDRARSLLSIGEKSVTEVATACGFSSIYAFSRAFRAQFGVCPTDISKRSRRP